MIMNPPCRTTDGKIERNERFLMSFIDSKEACDSVENFVKKLEKRLKLLSIISSGYKKVKELVQLNIRDAKNEEEEKM